jgi:peptide/nickel transport system permease protein
VLERVPATMELVLAAMLASVVISIPAGVIAAVNRGKWQDKSMLMGSLFGISAPPFWVGIFLILIFVVELQWLPASGRGSWAHLILPAGSLALYRVALTIRLVRSGMLEVLSQDYIRTARAKGLSERTIVYKHALRNTMVPVVTVIGLQMGALLTGSIVTERIFAWPGMGWLIVEALSRLDYPVVTAYTMFTALIFVVMNLAVDLAYGLLDPKVRYS